jgi:hypothetical protein
MEETARTPAGDRLDGQFHENVSIDETHIVWAR